MSERKQKISIVCDKELAERLRQRQENLSRQLGARISLNQATVAVLRQGLQEAS
jgi:post-segregation antitoxin (ccd killing protein)